jgi:hypothetical protein
MYPLSLTGNMRDAEFLAALNSGWKSECVLQWLLKAKKRDVK